jgi:hypothetical protein
MKLGIRLNNGMNKHELTHGIVHVWVSEVCEGLWLVKKKSV